jgi:threonine dehydrogenase-like Zn-dependent dehydrogenase
MRAAVLTAPGTIAMVEQPLPDPGAGEVRLKVEGCGVCASNLGPWSDPSWQNYPGEPGGMGHEAWGLIDAIGVGVEELAVGQRVVALSGRSYASHDIVAANRAVAVPGSIAGPFPGEAVACAMNIFRRSELRPGQRVAIIGIGFLGAILTRLAADAGAEVIAISRREESLALARAMGASHTIPMHDHHAIMAEVQQRTGGQGCERVIEAVGKQWPLDLAGELVAEGGRLVIAGYHQDGPRQVNMRGWNWKGIDVVNAHERSPAVQMQGLRKAVDAVASGRLDVGPLMTHRFPLDRLADALDATRDKPGGFVKAWVDCA